MEEDPHEQSGVRIRPVATERPAWPAEPRLPSWAESDLDGDVEQEMDTMPLPLVQRAPVRTAERRVGRSRRNGGLSRASLKTKAGYLAGATLVVALATALVGVPPALLEGPSQYQAEEIVWDVSWTESRSREALVAELEPAFGLGALELGAGRDTLPSVLAWADLPEVPLIALR